MAASGATARGQQGPDRRSRSVPRIYLLLGLPELGLPLPGFCVEPPVPPVPCDGVLPCCEPPEPEPPIPPPLLPLPGVPLIPPPGFEPPEGLGVLELPEPGLPDLLGLFGSLMLLRSLSRSAMVLPPIVKSMPGTDAPGECDMRLAATVPHTTKDIE
jgi:hypothetical protein